MGKCYLVYHNAQKKHIVAVCKCLETALLLKEKLYRKIGNFYEIEERDFIW